MDLMVATLLACGVIAAIIIPSGRRGASGEGNLFTVMESDSVNPIFSSASAIRVLNGAAKQVARFAGYDEFNARIDMGSGATLARVTRFSGDLFSMLDVQFEARASNHWQEPSIYISEGFWQRVFAGKIEVIGTILEVNQSAYRIAGITRNGAGFLQGTDVWVPVQSRSILGGLNSMRIIAALVDPNRWSSAQQEITAAMKEYLSDQPYFETPGAKFVPVVNRLYFAESPAAIADRNKRDRWAGT